MNVFGYLLHKIDYIQILQRSCNLSSKLFKANSYYYSSYYLANPD